jgi:hypothetical protein
MRERAAMWNLHLIYRLSHVPARFDDDVLGKVRALAGGTSVAAASSPAASMHLAFSTPYAQVVGTAVAATQCLREALDAHNATGGVAADSAARGRTGRMQGGVAHRGSPPGCTKDAVCLHHVPILRCCIRACAPSPQPRIGSGSCSAGGLPPQRCKLALR